MSPELMEWIEIILAPTGLVMLIAGGIIYSMKSKHDKALIIAQSDADDKTQDNANFKALIKIIATDGETTAKIAENITLMVNNHREEVDKLETAIDGNSNKIESLDSVIKNTSDNTLVQIDTLSVNLTSQFLDIQKQLKIMSNSFADNKSQHDKIQILIREFEMLVGKLNVITDAKEKTQPLPNLSKHQTVAPLTDKIESEDTDGHDS